MRIHHRAVLGSDAVQYGFLQHMVIDVAPWLGSATIGGCFCVHMPTLRSAMELAYGFGNNQIRIALLKTVYSGPQSQQR